MDSQAKLQQRIDENRRRALAIRAAKISSALNPSNEPSVPTSSAGRKPFQTLPGNPSLLKCSLVNVDRFLVTCPYNAKLVTLFKSISSRRFDPESKGWTFNISDFDTLESKLKNNGHHLPQIENAALVKGVQGSTLSVPINDMCRGMCYLISNKRFEIDMPFNKTSIEVFKSMSTKSYNPTSRRWSFDLTEYNKLATSLGQEASIYVEPLSSVVLRTFMDRISGNTQDPYIPEADISNVDYKISSSLMPFQKDGVNFAISRNGRILLADDMGLGKTVQSICIAAYYRHKWPLLIVCPSSVRLMWKEALLKWLPTQVCDDDINLVLTGRDLLKHASQITIISYDLLNRKQKEVQNHKYGVAILDESHFVKNFKTVRTKAATAALKSVDHVMLLSGTPALSRPAELFTQLSIIRPDLFPYFHDFGMRYCDGKKNNFGWEYTGSSNMDELSVILRETVMLRRTKDDVLTQLPPKLRRSVALDVGAVKTTSGQQKAMTEASAAIKEKGLSALERHGVLLQFFNETARLKLPAVKSYVIELLESDRKLLLFAHHKMVLDAMEKELNKKNYEFIRIDGSTPSERRQTQVATFQEKSSCKVALLSITAANMGITLNAASLVVFAELFWNPGILVQAEDRCYRIGQRDVVNVHYLIAKGTADDYIWQMVKDKLEVLSKAGLNKTDFADAESHVAAAPKRNDLLNYFQSTKQPPCDDTSAECDVIEDEDEDDLMMLEALEQIESQESDLGPEAVCDVTRADAIGARPSRPAAIGGKRASCYDDVTKTMAPSEKRWKPKFV